MIFNNFFIEDHHKDTLIYVKSLEKRHGLKIGCPEEVSWRMGFIKNEDLFLLANKLLKSGYGEYLLKLIDS